MDYQVVNSLTGESGPFSFWTSPVLVIVYTLIAAIALWGLIVVWKDKRLLVGHKVAWTILLLLFHVFAFIAFYLWKMPMKKKI